MDKIPLYFVLIVAIAVFSACGGKSSFESGAASVYLNQGMLASGEYGVLVDSRDNRVYRVVTLGEQTWMAENLNYSLDAGSQSWCWGDDEGFCAKYGRLYTWNAAVRACPEGWHLPTQNEFESLVKLVDSGYPAPPADEAYSSVAGKRLKSAAVWGGSGVGSNDVGFSAVPAGRYDGELGSFFLEGADGVTYFWGGTELESDKAFFLNIGSDDDGANLGYLLKIHGNSVRCVKNAD